MTDNSNGTNATSQGTNNSTLLEFPGVNRNRPAWRKELSERFREIQQRRAREAALETESHQRAAVRGESEYERHETPPANHKQAERAKQLGLVPSPDGPELNPLVAAALRRIERARAQTPTHTRQGSGRGQAATAAARVVEEQPEQFDDPALAARRDEQTDSQTKRTSRRAEKPDAHAKSAETQARATTLAVVQPKQSNESARVEEKVSATKADTTVEAKTTATTETKAAAVIETRAVAETTTSAAATVEIEKQTAPSTPAAVTTSAEPRTQPAVARTHSDDDGQSQTQTAARQPRKIEGVLDEFWLERQGLDPLPKVSAPELSYDDRAPRAKRIAAAVVDLIAVALLCAPFAAAIELTIGNWGDPHVYGSMAGIVVGVMFLYHTCSVALAGRTWGMALCSLRALDSRTALVPTTGQCARRAFAYILSLATLGLGIVYSIFDAEGRTAHDLLSGTVVVRH